MDVDDYLNMQKNLGRKSIPLDYLKEFEVRQHGYYSHYLEKVRAKLLAITDLGGVEMSIALPKQKNI